MYLVNPVGARYDDSRRGDSFGQIDYLPKVLVMIARDEDLAPLSENDPKFAPTVGSGRNGVILVIIAPRLERQITASILEDLSTPDVGRKTLESANPPHHHIEAGEARVAEGVMVSPGHPVT